MYSHRRQYERYPQSYPTETFGSQLLSVWRHIYTIKFIRHRIDWTRPNERSPVRSCSVGATWQIRLNDLTTLAAISTGASRSFYFSDVKKPIDAIVTMEFLPPPQKKKITDDATL